MGLSIVDDAVVICSSHLKDNKLTGTEIEAYLTRYLVVLAFSAFEQEYLDLIKERMRQPGDPRVAAFAAATCDRIVRSIKISELAGLLAMFGEDCKNQFMKKIKNKDPHAAYDSIINNRHAVAHGAIMNMTFGEFVNNFKASKIVLREFKKALNKK